MDRAPGTLEIAFSWLGDRYGHRLTWRQAGEVWAEAESVEGSSGPDRAGESLATDPSHSSAEPTSDPAWPPSPPWQQVTEHARGQLLLLGMAGSSHWSSSLELLETHSGLVWDIACRVQSSPHRLGHTFRWTRPPAIIPADVMIERCFSMAEVSESEPARPIPVEVAGSTFRFVWRPQVAGLPTTLRWRLQVSAVELP